MLQIRTGEHLSKNIESSDNMSGITQETKVQNSERKCIELARCRRNDKVVFGKQMKGYGMRMPEGLGFCDALDWIAEYMNKVYAPDAIDITVRVRALERSDIGYRPMLIQSEDETVIEKAELGMNDVFLPNGESASRCPYHVHLRMNTLMADDFEELGDRLAGSAASEAEDGNDDEPDDGSGSDDDEDFDDEDPIGEESHQKGKTDLRNPYVIENLDIDLRNREGPFLSERGQIRHGELVDFIIHCPNHDVAFDLLQTIDERYFPDEDQEESPRGSS